MKNMTFLVKIALGIIFLLQISCSKKYYSIDDLQKIRWLEGNWTFDENGIRINESWQYYPAENAFLGKSIIAIGKDTIYVETKKLSLGRGKRIILQSFSGMMHPEEQELMYVSKLNNRKLILQNIDKSIKTVYYIKRESLQIKTSEITSEGKKVDKQYFKKL